MTQSPVLLMRQCKALNYPIKPCDTKAVALSSQDTECLTKRDEYWAHIFSERMSGVRFTRD